MKLIKAIGFGNIELVKELVNKDNINHCLDLDNCTVIHYACWWNKLDIVKYLISIGADINIKDDLQRTPLDTAILNKSIEVKEYLESLIVKEVTMEEVCKKFGCQVKIIKG